MYTSPETLTLVAEYTGTDRGTLSYTFQDAGVFIVSICTCYAGPSDNHIEYTVSTTSGSVTTDWSTATDLYNGYSRGWVQIGMFRAVAGEIISFVPSYITGDYRSYKIYKVC